MLFFAPCAEAMARPAHREAPEQLKSGKQQAAYKHRTRYDTCASQCKLGHKRSFSSEVSLMFLMASLILAQDQRWRRA
jgi:hypothetical protein